MSFIRKHFRWLKLLLLLVLLALNSQAQASGFSLAWQYNGVDWAEHPIIYNGVAYVPWTEGRLTAHELKTGKLLHSLDGVANATAPFVAGDSIYSFTDALGMVEINLDAFTITRSLPIPNAWYTENVPYDAESGFFYARQGVASEYKGRLTAFRVSDGAAAWSFPQEYAGGFSNHQNPIVVGDSVYFQSTNSYWLGASKFYRLDKRSGEVIWEQTLSTIEGDSTSRGGYNNPIYDADHDVLYVTESWNRQDARVYALRRTDGKLLWSKDLLGRAIESTLTYYADTLYLPLHVFSGHGSYMAISALDGSEIWHVPGFYEEDGWSATGVDGKYLYRTTHGASEPHLIVQDRLTGELVWSLPIEANADCFNPVFSDGLVLLGSETSLYALKVGYGLRVNSDFHGKNATGYNPYANFAGLDHERYLPMMRQETRR